jgi:hypothetical protein
MCKKLASFTFLTNENPMGTKTKKKEVQNLIGNACIIAHIHFTSEGGSVFHSSRNYHGIYPSQNHVPFI